MTGVFHADLFQNLTDSISTESSPLNNLTLSCKQRTYRGCLSNFRRVTNSTAKNESLLPSNAIMSSSLLSSLGKGSEFLELFKAFLLFAAFSKKIRRRNYK